MTPSEPPIASSPPAGDPDALPQPPIVRQTVRRRRLVRLLWLLTLALGGYYLTWRLFASVDLNTWFISIPLWLAELYSFIGAFLFGLTVWRIRERGEPPPPPEGATVDIFITCYNEPVELVRETVRAALAVHHRHRTYLLDDGASEAMRAMAEAEGAGYLVRSVEWHGKQRHAKAGNLNNALFQTTGEFILVLDADQIPAPQILDRTLGYFRDPRMGFVQTPQWFYNVPAGDPFGCEAPLFYGPIQQGKDGWNAAFFCGSNAVLRREALMQVGIVYYVKELELRVRRALSTADQVLRSAERHLARQDVGAAAGLRQLRLTVRTARRELRAGRPVQEVTWEFQRAAEAIARRLVRDDLGEIRRELAGIPGVDGDDLEASFAALLEDEDALAGLAGRESSPLAAIETVRELLLAVDLDRSDEAQPVQPMATISVTEDMSTAMRLHSLGWRSAYHHQIVARGLAPEDLRSALQQRLRWAQGTLQVMLRENPLTVRGLAHGQRLMYFATMWSYLSGFATLVYLVAPMLYLAFGISPVIAFQPGFFLRLIPYLVVNQLVFLVVGWGMSTWRGQQYSLALFPLWIRAVVTAAGNVYFGRKLGFVVTPKQRQGGIHWRLIWPQLVVSVLLVLASIAAIVQLSLGVRSDGGAVLANLFWAGYDLLMLSVVVRAVTYRPKVSSESALSGEAAGMADLRGRMGKAA